MRWDCDSAREERKSRRLRAKTNKILARAQWHRKFAFFPKRIRLGLCVWLEWYERRAAEQGARGYSYDSYRLGDDEKNAHSVVSYLGFWNNISIEWEYREHDDIPG